SRRRRARGPQAGDRRNRCVAGRSGAGGGQTDSRGVSGRCRSQAIDEGTRSRPGIRPRQVAHGPVSPAVGLSAEVADRRRLSPAHLSRWYNLVGFCLRPGFGDPMDKYRVDQLWKLLHTATKGGLAQPEGGADFWIMWRRVAGGLGTALQNTLYSR